MGFFANFPAVNAKIFAQLGQAAFFRRGGQLARQNIAITLSFEPVTVTENEQYDNRVQLRVAVNDSECTPTYSDIFTINNIEYLVIAVAEKHNGITYLNCVSQQEPKWQR